MNNFDYEIRGYVIEWKIGGIFHKQDGFATEDAALAFAREIEKSADSVCFIQERYAIGW